MPASATLLHLVLIGVDVGAEHLEVRRAGGDRGDRLVAGVLEAVRDEVGEELLVARFVPGDPVDEAGQIGLLDAAPARLRQKTAWVRSVNAMYTRVSTCE